MSNTTMIESFLTTVSLIQTNTILYGYSIIFLFGNVGSVLNVLVLMQRNYRQNSCSCYILASTITNLFIFNFNRSRCASYSVSTLIPRKHHGSFVNFEHTWSQMLGVDISNVHSAGMRRSMGDDIKISWTTCFHKTQSFEGSHSISGNILVCIVLFLFHCIKTSFKVSSGKFYSIKWRTFFSCRPVCHNIY